MIDITIVIRGSRNPHRENDDPAMPGDVLISPVQAHRLRLSAVPRTAVEHRANIRQTDSSQHRSALIFNTITKHPPPTRDIKGAQFLKKAAESSPKPLMGFSISRRMQDEEAGREGHARLVIDPAGSVQRQQGPRGPQHGLRPTRHGGGSSTTASRKSAERGKRHDTG